MARRPTLRYNVQLVSSRQSGESQVRRTAKEVSNGFARLIVRDVAIAASKRYQREIGATFQRNIEKAVRAELERIMGHMGRMMVRPESADGPSGTLNFGTGEGYKPTSDLARMRGWGSSYNVASAGIKWAPRDPDYVRRKRDKSWWRKTGHLANYLSRKSSRWFEQALGPIKVLWWPTSVSSRSELKTTSSGSKGPPGERVRIGRIEVIAFGDISPEDLPGLAEFAPMDAPPERAGLAGYFAARYYNRQTAKLMHLSTGKRRIGGGMQPRRTRSRYGYKMTRSPVRYQSVERQYRPFMDPFISFFLTRSMPNAVWRRLEREFRSTKRIQQQRSGVRDASGFGP